MSTQGKFQYTFNRLKKSRNEVDFWLIDPELMGVFPQVLMEK